MRNCAFWIGEGSSITQLAVMGCECLTLNLWVTMGSNEENITSHSLDVVGWSEHASTLLSFNESLCVMLSTLVLWHYSGFITFLSHVPGQFMNIILNMTSREKGSGVLKMLACCLNISYVAQFTSCALLLWLADRAIFSATHCRLVQWAWWIVTLEDLRLTDKWVKHTLCSYSLHLGRRV